MMVRVLFALVLLLLGSGTSHAAEERSAPSRMAERLLSAQLPWRDPLDLAVRFRGVPATTPVAATITPAPRVAGSEDSFWILDQRSARLLPARATLRHVSQHAYWFVQTDMADRLTQTDLEQSATVFETRTYPLIHTYFGAEPSPTVDGDPHVVFLLANVPGVAAYFSSTDAYPRAIYPSSNEHDMIYVNLNSLRPGQPDFDSTVTHEFQHMAHFARCPAQEGWVDEGASELAMRVAGYEGGQPLAFASHPDVQLNAWSTEPSELARHYQAAYLFMRYVAERDGGWNALPDLLQTCARGEDLFSAFLARQPIAPDMDSLFADWTVANLLQDATVADGRYAYANGGFHAAVTGSLDPDAPFLGAVPQYAANYIDLPPGAGTARFSGDAAVPLLAAPIDVQGVWWSNRGDSMDSRLTRRIDLRGVSEATLGFRAWYDLEDQFDYVYLSASSDGGKTWQALDGRQTTPDRATGNDYGVGWTASSGTDWVDEEVDLSRLAGSEILLRFEYVTDQNFNGQGFAFKDLTIPQIGLSEPGAVEGPWTAEGWVRVDAAVPERWNLRLARWIPGGVVVDAVAVAADGTATFALDPAASRSTLVIGPTAPRTLLAGNYSVAVGP
ncbi:MAG: immune inhibitor A [Chloroflexota bacterium]|nr:immune inhibitor A [Chloroflexota bacterium]